MFRNRRILLLAVVLGVGITVVSFLGAARLTGGDTSPKGNGDAKATSHNGEPARGAVICLGTIDGQQRAFGLFPNNFPQPSEVKQILVKEGETVAHKQKLLQLTLAPDTVLADLAVEEAQSAVEEAEALLAQANQALEAHQFAIDVQSAIVDARRLELNSKQLEMPELERAAKAGVKTKEQLESTKEGIKALEKGIEAEDKKLAGLKKIRPTTKVDQARAALKRAQDNLKKAQHIRDPIFLEAPSAGRILRSNVAIGTSFGPQTREPAFLFLPGSTLIVRAEVEQEFITRIAKGAPAIIEDYSNSGVQWKGRVLEIAPAFLPKRTPGQANLDVLNPANDSNVLECIVSVERTAGSPQEAPPVGQRVRVYVGSE
jgi:multidrug efflux pump subunit AcrA (membrane-fusion protein)